MSPSKYFSDPRCDIRLLERNHRIRQNQKIRPAPLPINRIAGVRIARNQTASPPSPSDARPPKIPTSPHDPSPRHTPPHAPAPSESPAAHRQFHRMVILRPQPVLQHKRRHAALIQPPRNRKPLLLHRQMLYIRHPEPPPHPSSSHSEPPAETPSASAYQYPHPPKLPAHPRPKQHRLPPRRPAKPPTPSTAAAQNRSRGGRLPKSNRTPPTPPSPTRKQSFSHALHHE